MRSNARARTILIVALVSAACGPAAGSPGPTTPAQATAVPTASESAPSPSSEPTTASVAPASALEGTWRTDVIDQRAVEATLERQGLGDWTDEFRSQSPIAAGMKLVLVIEAGQWDLYGESADGGREPIDYDAEYRIDGDSVSVFHADGTRSLGWSVEDDVLTIESKSTTLSATAGIPDEVFQVALYVTETFVRQAF
jgi:hypothetical protein